MTKINRAAHKEVGTADKVYLVCIQKKNNREYEVVGKWGRRGSNLRQQGKGSFATVSDAERKAEDLFREKLRGGYVDVETPQYSGSVKVADFKGYLEPEFNGEKGIIETVKESENTNPKPEKKVKLPDNFVVVCLDNDGMQDYFDKQITYMARPHSDGEMVYVTDRLGEERECFSDRFEITDDE